MKKRFSKFCINIYRLIRIPLFKWVIIGSLAALLLSLSVLIIIFKVHNPIQSIGISGSGLNESSGSGDIVFYTTVNIIHKDRGIIPIEKLTIKILQYLRVMIVERLKRQLLR